MEINNQQEYNYAISEYVRLAERRDKAGLGVEFRLSELSSAIEKYEETHYKQPNYQIPNSP